MTPLIVVGSFAVAAVLVWQRIQQQRLANAAQNDDAYALSPTSPPTARRSSRPTRPCR